jgi:uncharacterized protein (DUF433 family)
VNDSELLSRPVYGMAQVDRILRLKPGTARRWIDGYERSGHPYLPVVRERSTGSDLVTWGEFVEARLLAEYRNSGVPMRKMRPVVEGLRKKLRTPYPLAEMRPFAQGKELVLEIQTEIGLEPELLLVELRTNQILLTPPAQQFRDAVNWSAGKRRRVAQSLRLEDSAESVIVDPLVAFGEPAVRAVRTEILASAHRAGESIAELATGYDLEEAQVTDALRYELSMVA